ncbi:MAG: tetratricopeptide repeat protein [Bacteroidetes bacterium]|jgi:tetratricopeptide (TPR) repeat protein|nr:tetratricopeptide repeat protein [Bacteroidota bacterium]
MSSPEIDQLLAQAHALRYENPLETCRLARQALALAEQAEDPKARAQALRILGAGNVILCDFREAVQFLSAAYELFKAQDEEEGKIHTASNLAAAFQKMGNYTLALRWNLEALRQRNSTRIDPITANTLINLATVYYKLGQLDPCEEYAEQSKEAFHALNDLHGLAIAYTTLGNVAEKRGDTDKALKYLQIAEVNARKHDNPATLAPVLQSMGLLYQKTGKEGKALLNFWEALNIQEEIGDKQAMGSLYVDMSHVHNAAGAYADALEYGEKALSLAREIGNKENEYQAHKALSQLYEKINEHHEALYHYKQYHKLQREVIGVQTSMHLNVNTEMQGSLDTREQLEQLRYQVLQAEQLFYEKTLEAENLADQKDRLEAAMRQSLRMQEGAFATEEDLLDFFPDSFMYYRPMQVVPQTVMWLHKTEDRKLLGLLEYPNDEAATYALVAMLTHMTRHILNGAPLLSSGEMLHKLNEEVMNNPIWQQQLVANPVNAAFVVIDPGLEELQFSGVNLPLHLFSGGKHIVLQGDKHPIGGGAEKFNTRSLPLEDVDRIYLWNDALGHIGTGKNALTHQLILQLLTSLHGRTMQKQRVELEERLDVLLAEHSPSHDLALVGIRLNGAGG